MGGARTRKGPDVSYKLSHDGFVTIAPLNLSLMLLRRQTPEHFGGREVRGPEQRNSALSRALEAGSRGPSSTLNTYVSAVNHDFYILAPVRAKVVALSIETLRWRTLGVCY